MVFLPDVISVVHRLFDVGVMVNMGVELVAAWLMMSWSCVGQVSKFSGVG
jgi:hypothetical protein